MSSSRWSLALGVAAIAAVSLSACTTLARWKHSEHEASVHREQVQQAADDNTDSKADRAFKAKLSKHDARLRHLQAELSARGDPDSLAASALFEKLLSGASGGSALQLADRAVAGAPRRAYLTYLLLQLCQSAPNCDTAPVEARLRLLDPGNGIAWTYALLRADEANDGTLWRAARDGLAQSARITMYWNDIVSHLSAAAAGKAGFDASSAMLEVIGSEATLLTPLQPVSRACSEQEIQQPAVLAQCRRIATAFRQGDIQLFEGFGSGLAMRLWPEGSAQRRAVAAETRGLHYRMDLMNSNAAKLDSPRATRALAALYPKYPTEQSAFRAWYVDMGLNPDPPAGWVDHTPGG